jgi:hypothetical protein
MNRNLADYLIPVNAYIDEIDLSAINVPGPKLEALGARGIGEIGVTGTRAVVANAVFHATRKRVRDLPIRWKISHKGTPLAAVSSCAKNQRADSTTPRSALRVALRLFLKRTCAAAARSPQSCV